jgi:RNA-directed DNA polymerase
VKVPEGAPPAQHDIEELFPAVWLGEKVDGKPFDKKKPHGDHTTYGKVIFAEKVVRPNAAKIDFTSFEPLLLRIEGCVKHYAALVAAKAPAAPAPAAKVAAASP